MKNIYFISDVHLAFHESEHEQLKRERLIAFLEEISQDAGALYLLGDIFDFWFEWYHVIPRYWFPILHQLRKMVDAGIRVHFVTGNHDFYTGRFLEREVGIRCFDENVIFQEGGKQFFAGHGDGYAKNDRGYRFLKRIIRNRFSIFLFKTFVPPDLGMQIAKWTSHSSRKLVKIEKSTWVEEYFQFAREKFSQGFDYVLLGHIHTPVRREEQGKVYVNCGDWMRHFTFAKYDGNDLTVNSWADRA